MCPALCDPIDCSPPGSSIHGILQGRILEWVAISFSRAGLPYPEIKPEFPALAGGFFAIESPGKPLKWVCVFSCVRLFATPWAVARWPPLSMGFSRQEYWRGLPCLSPGDIPDPRVKSTFLTSPALAGRFCFFFFFLPLAPSQAARSAGKRQKDPAGGRWRNSKGLERP